jgi:hypothetical protein
MRKTKYTYLTILQGDYGQGWEDLGEANTKSKKEMVELKKFEWETRNASRGMNAKFRYVERRVLNTTN